MILLPIYHTKDAVPEFLRSSGESICCICGKSYYNHQKHIFADKGKDDPWALCLTQICNGEYKKL